MILLIDNYDSFTYNLYQAMAILGAQIEVRRNDALTPRQTRDLSPRGIVISPGPGTPKDAGVSLATLAQKEQGTPLLGVCLGHQCVAVAFGARVVRASTLMHGKVSPVHHDGRGLFMGLPSPFLAVRYHSLIVERDSLPACLEVTAETEDGVIMALRHRTLAIEGVQFHPESVLTTDGPLLLRNFLTHCGEV